MGARKHNWEAIKALFIAGKTAREIGIAFNVHPAQVLNMSKAGNWGALRKALKQMPHPMPKLPEIKMQNMSDAKATEVVIGLEEPQNKNIDKSKSDSSDAFSRAIRLRSSDSFRERVISQADKALSTLEKSVMNNVYECDRFAEALTKVERIGARAYGYDRESEHPIINIGILGSGQEYEPT